MAAKRDIYPGWQPKHSRKNQSHNKHEGINQGDSSDAALRQKPAALQRRPYVQITVTDTGVGIPEEIINRIFDPFFTSKESGKGTGLGLSICLGIVKNHGGAIDVQSQVGKRTTFSVYLPALPTGVLSQKESRPDCLECGHGELILVVDDEQRILDLACATFENFGYQSLAAASGQQALDAIGKSTEPVNIALVDMMMPQMDGIHTIAEIRKLAPDCRIIAMSGLRLEARVEDASLAGASAFLSKPFDDVSLISVVRQVLTSGQCGEPGTPFAFVLDP